MKYGGTNNPGFEALPDYVQAKILANMGYGGMTYSFMENGGQLPTFQGNVDPSQVMKYDSETDTYESRYALPEGVIVTGKAPRDSWGRKLSKKQIAFNKKIKENNPLTNFVYETTGVPAMHRIGEDPMGTLKGMGYTLGDLAMLPFAPPPLFPVNPLTNQSYGAGLPQTLDVLSVLPYASAPAKLATKATKELATRTVRGGKLLANDLKYIYDQSRPDLIKNVDYLRSQFNPPMLSEQVVDDMAKLSDAYLDVKKIVYNDSRPFANDNNVSNLLSSRKNAAGLIDSDLVMDRIFRRQFSPQSYQDISKTLKNVANNTENINVQKVFNPEVIKRYPSLPFKSYSLFPEVNVTSYPREWAINLSNRIRNNTYFDPTHPIMGTSPLPKGFDPRVTRPEELIHYANSLGKGRGDTIALLKEAGRRVAEAPEGKVFVPAGSLSTDSFKLSSKALQKERPLITGGRDISVTTPSFNEFNSMGQVGELMNIVTPAHKRPEILTAYVNRLIHDLNKAKGYKIPYSFTSEGSQYYPQYYIQTKGKPLINSAPQNNSSVLLPNILPPPPQEIILPFKNGGSTWSGNAWYGMGGYVPQYGMGGLPCYNCGGMFAEGGEQEMSPEPDPGYKYGKRTKVGSFLGKLGVKPLAEWTGANDSKVEDILEFIDPTGLSRWDDAAGKVRQYNKGKGSLLGTAAAIAGALPQASLFFPGRLLVSSLPKIGRALHHTKGIGNVANAWGMIEKMAHLNPNLFGPYNYSSPSLNYQEGGPVAGEEMEVTPDQLEDLRRRGYKFEII